MAAQRLPSSVTPEHYDLAFSLDLDHEHFEGVETIRVRVAETTPRVVLHSVDLDLREVTIGAGPAAQTGLGHERRERADRHAHGANADRCRAHRDSHSLQRRPQPAIAWLLREPGQEPKYAVTQFESTDARRAFPCFDEPAFKATFAVTLTIDRGDVAISNGKVLSDTPGPGNTQHTVKFATTAKMSSYLVAMAVGDFQCLEGAADNIPIRVCATPDKKELGHIALEAAQQTLSFYDRLLRHPLPVWKARHPGRAGFRGRRDGEHRGDLLSARRTCWPIRSPPRSPRARTSHRSWRTRWRTSGSAIS